MIKLPKGVKFDTSDVATLCKIDHEVVIAMFKDLISHGDIPDSDSKGVRLKDDDSVILGYDLSEAEFIYLVFKLHVGSVEDLNDKFIKHINSEKEIAKLNLLFPSVSLSGVGKNKLLEIGGLKIRNENTGKTTLEQVGVDMMRELFPDDY